jgi:hypothetical protein
MDKKWWNVLNMVVLAIMIFGLGFIVFNSFTNSGGVPLRKCVDVNGDSSFFYEACYDDVSKSIFLKMTRGKDDYKISEVKFYFFDYSKKFYELSDIPIEGGFKSYKISAEKNPGTVSVGFDVVKNFSEIACDGLREISVVNCPVRVDVSLSPLGDGVVGDFIDVNEIYNKNADILDSDLVDRERIWESKCKSNWECGSWDVCEDGVQRRDCEDLNDCVVSVDAPVSVRYCEGGCVENWECRWSSCSNGVSVPNCEDSNNCGTEYDVPKKLDCGGKDLCVPDVQCGGWSACEVDYNFVSLVDGVQDLTGVKSRICEDVSGCIVSRQEVKSCSISVDVYTERFLKCGKEYVAVYDSLNGGLVARIEEGKKENPYLNINFGDRGENDYCDYCYDGVLSGDEDGVDCGGGCETCDKKYKSIKRAGFLGRIWDWVF